MKVNEKKWIRFRIYLVAVFFIFALSTVLSRAVQLQVIDKERLQKMASDGYRKVVTLPPKRGSILDHEGHELAVGLEVGSVYAEPRRIEDKANAARQLALHLDMPAGQILKLLNRDRGFVYLKRKIPPAKIENIAQLRLQGIGFTKETKRFFPGKEIAGQLLGIVGDENQGLEGLEKRYDDLLRGEAQVLVQMKDAVGRPFYISKPAEEARDTHNLILTIDKDIQYKAEQALEKAVTRAKAKSGQCLVMNPETGEILAMATARGYNHATERIAPAFNPNIFQDYKPDAWRNRVITDTYEPGSIIKAFLLASALDAHAVTPNTKFNCENGEYRIANRMIHDAKKHSIMTVSDIIVVSSNIGAYKIGNELGYENFYEYMSKFGFGQKTGVDLIGERDGLLKKPEGLGPVERANIYFGQGMTASSIQLAAAMSAIANGGRLMKPYVVKAVTDESGEIIKEYQPEFIRRVISQDTAKTASRILEDVATEKGTALDAAIEGYRVAGKTSTAQKVDPETGRYSDRDYVALFAGFVPANRPKLVILSMIDSPRGVRYGGLVAAPVFRAVGRWALSNLRVQPQLILAENETVSGSKNSQAQKRKVQIAEVREIKEEIKEAGAGIDPEANLLPDFRGLTMREVLINISALGINITFEGSGRAYEQKPEPGVNMENVSSVKVSFRPPA
ncbi:MAG: transpeptidase family protein [Deltaproteobacteria bacterium]|nr:transpeptidase family protein [Deltaproteobacteria bacterium]